MKAFECRMCGECCYGEGGIYLSRNEQERLARFLSISREDLFSGYLEERNGRVYIRVGADNFCIFYRKGVGCTIHPVKPERCALWPYYPANITDEDTWVLAKLACRGLNRECAFDDFVREARSATSYPSQKLKIK
ncbi:MAG: YkgJ family cysteine cluster protein [Deltaproteobacteria bacterium]|nr:YkgJ family cysteine cluster protein [Deltaproteobacteria bacterium]